VQDDADEEKPDDERRWSAARSWGPEMENRGGARSAPCAELHFPRAARTTLVRATAPRYLAYSNCRMRIEPDRAHQFRVRKNFGRDMVRAYAGMAVENSARLLGM